jgi:hypothetical protein
MDDAYQSGIAFETWGSRVVPDGLLPGTRLLGPFGTASAAMRPMRPRSLEIFVVPGSHRSAQLRMNAARTSKARSSDPRSS